MQKNNAAGLFDLRSLRREDAMSRLARPQSSEANRRQDASSLIDLRPDFTQGSSHHPADAK